MADESDGIMELPPDARPGAPLAEVLGLPDAVFDVDLTPNRGDCFSVLGIARDLAARTGTAVSGPAMQEVTPTADAVHAVELVDSRPARGSRRRWCAESTPGHSLPCG
ncbi:MAG: hypothetical protein U5K76_05395 [Woeseiaceae bacterium]|nr:hypothetical protein [Woeseiaceae bacterium]